MANVQDLQAQLEQINASLKTEQQREDGADASVITQLQEQYQAVLAQIHQAEIEEKVHSDGIPFAVEGVDFTDLPPQVITFVEAVVKADRRRIYAEHAAELDKRDKAAEERERQLQYQNDSLQQIIQTGKAENESLVRDNGNLRDHTANQNREIEDLRNKLANAAAQLDEKDKEIKRLNSEIEDYQKAKVFGERQAQKIIDVTPNEKDDIQAAAAEIKKLYASVENWGSINKVMKPDGSFELVKNADLEQWAPAASSLGGSNDTVSFPGQDQGDAADSGIQAPEVVAPPVGGTFQAENAVVGLAETDAGTQVAGKTLEERVAELEKAVFGKVNDGAAA